MAVFEEISSAKKPQIAGVGAQNSHKMQTMSDKSNRISFWGKSNKISSTDKSNKICVKNNDN